MREKIFNLNKKEKEIEKDEIINIIHIIKDYNAFVDLFKDAISKENFLFNIKNIKMIYENKENLHTFLYNSDKILHSEFDETPNLAFLFYFDLLIKHKKNLINYTYPIEAIFKIDRIKNVYQDNNINNTNEKDININNIIIIIISKIVHDLFFNYIGFEEYEEDKYINELIPIEEKNKEIIKNNIKYLQKLELNWNESDILDEKDIDEIYLGIIMALFNKGYYDSLKILLEKLNLDSMDITEAMKKIIVDKLNSEYDLNKYLIKEDKIISLSQEEIINFYYIIFKYLLREPFYIYKIPLFLKSKKTILELIKCDKMKLNISNLDKNLKEKYEYVLKMFLDSKYYEKNLNEIFNSSQKGNNNDISTKDKSNYNIKEEKSTCEEIISYKGEANEKDLLDKKVKFIYEKFTINDSVILFNNEIGINQEIIVLTSNSIYSKGEDLIAFYNIKKNQFEKIISGYSVSHGMTSLDIIEVENKKFLICACNKIKKNLKNGVLIIDLDVLNYKTIDEQKFIFFLETEFSVRSICHILNSHKLVGGQPSTNNIIYSKQNLYEEYILVGGLDEEKRSGTIKLYRFKFEEEPQNYKLEYLQDIDTFENFSGFEKSVNYIKQNKKNEEIIIRFDEKYYVFKRPNLDYYNKESSRGI